MEFKGTKGKWYSIYNNGSWNIQDEESFQEDSTSGFAEVYWFDDDKDTAQYNALLIQKAPEMLEMLKEVFNLLEENQGDAKFYTIGHHNRIKELIKQATEI